MAGKRTPVGALISLLVLCVVAWAAVTLTNHINAQSSSVTVTSGAVNMTGATLLVLSCHGAGASISFTASDSVNGSAGWQAGTAQTANTDTTQLFYACNNSVSATQTFTCTGGSGTDGSLNVTGFASTSAGTGTACLDVASAGSHTTTPGSVTTTVDGDVCVTAAGNDVGSATWSIDSSFVISDSYGAAVHENSAMAYLVTTTKGAINPTWTYDTAASVTNSVMMCFKPSAGAAAPTMIPSVY